MLSDIPRHPQKLFKITRREFSVADVFKVTFVYSYLECKIEHFKPRRRILMEWFYFPNFCSQINWCICWPGRETGELIWFLGSTSERNWDGCDLLGAMMHFQNCRRRSESTRSDYVENTNVMLRCWKYYKMKDWNISNQLSLTENTQNRLKLGRLFFFEHAQVCLNLTKIAKDIDDSPGGRGGEGVIFIPLSRLTKLQKFISSSLIFSVAVHAITRLLVNKIYQPLGISINSQISPRQTVDSFPHRIWPCYYKRTRLIKWASDCPCLPSLYTKPMFVLTEELVRVYLLDIPLDSNSFTRYFTVPICLLFLSLAVSIP